MPENQHHYVAIEGAIGVGKTTLARMLKEPLEAELLLEVFEENPFLGDFYTDPKRYAFQTQVFFLLSRYRQQHQVIRQTLRQHTLVSDYMFDKDWLFAHLNLRGDELTMYERVQTILSEQIPTPDLVVFLRADTDVLMQRISFRDRAYERTMSRDYIDGLRLAYEQFLAQYTAAPVLTIDTNTLDIVQDRRAREQLIGQVRETLSRGIFQQPLPDLEPSTRAKEAPSLPSRRRLSDFQRWHQTLDRHKGFLTDIYFNYICLTEEIGELGAKLKAVWRAQELLYEKLGNQQEARDRALQEHLPHLQEELADCLAYLLKLANYSGVDLESSYVAKMNANRERTW
jgi:deoxyadenosine/deoxycytidine kinase/NTP pyrophosphatase (non-canonical NTP hydrolase)